MATIIQFKRSSTSSAVPSTSDLSLGEIAVNTYHGRLYTKSDDGTEEVIEVGTNPTSLTINDAFTLPTSDGLLNQVLSTDGAGNVTWRDTSSGASGLITYNYTITSDTNEITGADDNNKVLSFVPGSEQVYLNGVKLVGGGSDYSTSGSDTVNLAENAVNGDTIEIIAYSAGIALIQGEVNDAQFSTTTANQVLTSFDKDDYKSVKFIINAERDSTGDRHASEVLLTHDGTDTFFVQYGDVWTDIELFSLDSDISGSLVRLLVTPAVTGLTIDVFEMKHT